MAKSTGQDTRGRRSASGMEGLSALDPTHISANLDTLFQVGTKVLDNWRVVSEEIMEFGKARLTRNIEAGRKVTRCTTIDQAFEAQADYARSLVQDYIAQTSKIAELSTRAMLGSISSAWQVEKESASRSADESHSPTRERIAAE